MSQREPLPLDVITDARHDTVHSDLGPSRPARSMRMPLITGPASFDATIGHGEPRITDIRPDGFVQSRIDEIKAMMLATGRKR